MICELGRHFRMGEFVAMIPFLRIAAVCSHTSLWQAKSTTPRAAAVL